MNGATIVWWIKQSDEAKKALFEEGKPLYEALVEFTKYILQFKNVKVWGNGLEFDNVIIKNAYTAIKKERPWSDFQDRDIRTIKELTETIHGK